MRNSRSRSAKWLLWAMFASAAGLSALACRGAAGQTSMLSANAELGHLNSTTATCDDPAVPPAAELCHPVGVGANNQIEVLFVADGDNNRVLRFNKAE